MQLLLVSYLAGILTVAAPCVLPLLPVIVGGSIVTGESSRQWWRPLVVTGSLAASVVVFALLLKATTVLLGVPQIVWSTLSGLVVLLIGVSMLRPALWEYIALKSGLYIRSHRLMQKTGQSKPGVYKDILMGASLGPVFSSCSPTYALVVAVVLPSSFAVGLGYLVAYALGLATILLLIAVAGRAVVRKLGWLSNPTGLFRKTIGILFVLVGVAVITGLDHELQSFVLQQGWYDPILRIEQQF